MRVTVLGSGSSSGTPSVEAGWGKCDPAEPRNQRLRPSIMVESDKTRVLVDTSPDLRRQLLNHDIQALDAVLLTHGHSDHLHGIDDLRGINRRMNRALPLFSDDVGLATVAQRFPYVLEPLDESATFYYKATLEAHEITPGEPFAIGDMSVSAQTQDHGYSQSLGFRLDDFAYTSDLVTMPEESFAALEGVRVWMLGTFSDKPHPTHLDVERALEWVARIKPERCVLTHLGTGLDYQTLKARLADNPIAAEPAYDGMVLEW